MKKLIALSLVIFFNLQQFSFAEIKSKLALEEIFMGCMEDTDAVSDEDIKIGTWFEYCGCTVNKISQTMDLEEVMRLGVDLMQIEDSSDYDYELSMLVLANEKMEDAVIKCAKSIYE